MDVLGISVLNLNWIDWYVLKPNYAVELNGLEYFLWNSDCCVLLLDHSSIELDVSTSFVVELTETGLWSYRKWRWDMNSWVEHEVHDWVEDLGVHKLVGFWFWHFLGSFLLQFALWKWSRMADSWALTEVVEGRNFPRRDLSIPYRGTSSSTRTSILQQLAWSFEGRLLNVAWLTEYDTSISNISNIHTSWALAQFISAFLL